MHTAFGDEVDWEFLSEPWICRKLGKYFNTFDGALDDAAKWLPVGARLFVQKNLEIGTYRWGTKEDGCFFKAPWKVVWRGNIDRDRSIRFGGL
jgi:hypothetical protein